MRSIAPDRDTRENIDNYTVEGLGYGHAKPLWVNIFFAPSRDRASESEPVKSSQGHSNNHTAEREGERFFHVA
jgi:hypothetical protein